MFDQLALSLFKQFILYGELTIKIGQSPAVKLQGARSGSSAAIHIIDSKTFWRIVFKPDLAIGEAYMDGALTIENNDLVSFVTLLMQNSSHWSQHWAGKLSLFISDRLNFITLANRQRASKRNVAHHYDLTDTLFNSFLDDRRQYSCGYFDTTDTPLEMAQITKLARLGAKLNLQKDDTVLDIGCGWGGLATALTQCQPGIHVTGITLSEHQLSYAKRAAEIAGLGNQLNFELRDYRNQTGQFDKIVSVGMLEHVGPHQFKTYFQKVKSLLREDGLAVIHSIAVHGKAQPVNRWLTKYIFPGGYLPSLEQMVQSTEMQGLKILDMEIMRGHYAETLKKWRQNFHDSMDEIQLHYDDRFIRMWDFYLVGCECFFRLQQGMVMQLQLGHDQMAAPANRRYIGVLQDEFEDILCNSSPSGNKNHSKS
jgi:cyclopropane-fatty-acyl-phospholipid synthase